MAQHQAVVVWIGGNNSPSVPIRVVHGHALAAGFDTSADEISAEIEDEEVFTGSRCRPCGLSTSSSCLDTVDHPTITRGFCSHLLPRSATTP